MSKERLEEITLEEIKRFYEGTATVYIKWLIEQAELAQELERENKELDYASKYNGELNEFLQKRKLPPNTLGRHVVDVVMDYVEELEKENIGLKQDLKNATEQLESVSDVVWKGDSDE